MKQSDVELFRAVQLEREAAYSPLATETAAVNKQIATIESELRESESAATQYELLAFIRSEKYECEPRNLAHALAGVPDLGWQRSFRRCGERASRMWPHRAFTTFKLIEGSSNNESPEAFCNALEQAIRSLPTRGGFEREFQQSLCANWRYFKLAVQAEHHRAAESRPFHVFAAYQRHIAQPRSAEEVLRASMEQIDPALRSAEPRGII